MRSSNYASLSTSPPTQLARKLRKTASLALRRRLSYGRARRYSTGKELDPETGLYYYGARYLDPKTSRWMSGDPAVAEYIPSAPVNDEAKKRNGNLPGMGGVFNYVNLHVYHYGGNNPVKLVDPDGEDFYNFTENDITVIPEKTSDAIVLVHPNEVYRGKIDGVMLNDDTLIKVNTGSSLFMTNVNGEDTAFTLGFVNDAIDLGKGAVNSLIRNMPDLVGRSEEYIYSGVYRSETEGHGELMGKWEGRIYDDNGNKVNPKRDISRTGGIPIIDKIFIRYCDTQYLFVKVEER